jgi:hypothetical protein
MNPGAGYTTTWAEGVGARVPKGYRGPATGILLPYRGVPPTPIAAHPSAPPTHRMIRATETFHVLCPGCGQRIEPLSHTETVETPSRADTELCRRCYQSVYSGVLPG